MVFNLRKAADEPPTLQNIRITLPMWDDRRRSEVVGEKGGKDWRLSVEEDLQVECKEDGEKAPTRTPRDCECLDLDSGSTDKGKTTSLRDSLFSFGAMLRASFGGGGGGRADGGVGRREGPESGAPAWRP